MRASPELRQRIGQDRVTEQAGQLDERRSQRGVRLRPGQYDAASASSQ
jgi:hypothetical protein